MTIRLGNAPCSWGAIEGFDSDRIPYARMLDELAETGYLGTELGDYGYLPTDAPRLREALERRRLVMLGAFEGVPLAHPGAVEASWPRVRRIAELLAAVADLDPRPPVLVLADRNNTDPLRSRRAGRAGPEDALPARAMRDFAAGAEELARRVREATGVRTVFHPHCAGYVETPEEVAAFLDATDADLVGLVFDTGHITYGAGTADDGTVALEALRRFAPRVRYVHFKDCSPEVARRARASGWDYTGAVGHGVFCELGRGSVDFAGILALLTDHGYDDWITVEQDVLPGMGTPRESAARNRAFLRTLGL